MRAAGWRARRAICPRARTTIIFGSPPVNVGWGEHREPQLGFFYIAPIPLTLKSSIQISLGFISFTPTYGLAVDGHPTAGDPGIRFAARADSGFTDVFIQSHGLARRWRRVHTNRWLACALVRQGKVAGSCTKPHGSPRKKVK